MCVGRNYSYTLTLRRKSRPNKRPSWLERTIRTSLPVLLKQESGEARLAHDGESPENTPRSLVIHSLKSPPHFTFQELTIPPPPSTCDPRPTSTLHSSLFTYLAHYTISSRHSRPKLDKKIQTAPACHDPAYRGTNIGFSTNIHIPAVKSQLTFRLRLRPLSVLIHLLQYRHTYYGLRRPTDVVAGFANSLE